MITAYKQLLEQQYKQLKIPDLTQIPWKFALFPADFFETPQDATYKVNYNEQKLIVRDSVTFFEEFPEIAQKYIYTLLEKFELKNLWSIHAHIFAQKRLVVYVAVGAEIEDPFIIPLQNAAIEHITIIIGKNAHAIMNEKMFAIQQKRIKNIDIILEENATLTFIVQYDDITNNAFLQYRFFLYRNAQLTSNFALRGGKMSLVLIDVYLCALGAQADIKGYYQLNNEQQLIVVTGQHHFYKQTISNIIMKGVLTDAAHAVYYGTIAIAKNAIQVQAYQENKNIVLSGQAKVLSQPNLEIQTDDVRCKHATAIGRFDADQLIYMQTRGISEELSQKLLLKAFIADVVHPN